MATTRLWSILAPAPTFRTPVWPTQLSTRPKTAPSTATPSSEPVSLAELSIAPWTIRTTLFRTGPDSDLADACISSSYTSANFEGAAYSDDADICTDGDDNAVSDDDGLSDASDTCLAGDDWIVADDDSVVACDNCAEIGNPNQENSDIEYTATAEEVAFASRAISVTEFALGV